MSTGWLDSIDRQTRLAGHNRLALLLLTLGDSAIYGLNVFKVQEVLTLPPITVLPGAHPLVRGTVEVRGHALPVIDLPRAMAAQDAHPQHLIVAEFNRSVQGFLVDEVLRIVHVDVADVEPPAPGGEFLTSIARCAGQFIQILDLEALLAEALGGPASLSHELVDGKAASGWRILLADDSRTARTQVERIVRQLGAELVAVNDGRQALDWLQAESQAGHLDDLLMVISDIEMPVMDGYTLTSEIRHAPPLAGLYVLLHTSLSGDFNHSMVQQVGADRFISKFSADELARAVLDRVHAVHASAAAQDSR
ncbi:MAG TPA: chemotaxis protein [Nevskiaceae bacterium]|nr:chemotaxis protein [Nevskiaceae bacterium]